MITTCFRLVISHILLKKLGSVIGRLVRQSALWKYLSLAIFLSALLSQPNIIIDKTIFLISAAKAQIIPETCVIQISGIITIFMGNTLWDDVYSIKLALSKLFVIDKESLCIAVCHRMTDGCHYLDR